MKFHALNAACCVAALSAFMAGSAFAQEHTDANGMPTTNSTPAEAAQTADLNNSVSANNQAADAQASANNAQYQSQLQQNQAAQQQYQNQSAAYENLRTRYAAERAAYHRGVWPGRYDHWRIVERDAHLVGERVELIGGSRVGTVVDTAYTGNHVNALLVKLDNDKVVWIDIADVRYNRADGVVMTNLDSSDLRHMADERL
jgi:hypothetical protein